MIEVSHLTKRFGDFTAVDDVSFSLAPGEILGFLGPNGAGKSTTMKMLTGFLAATEGTVSIWGFDINNDRLSAQSHIGYLPEGAPAYDEMTPLGYLKFIAEARGVSGVNLDAAVLGAVKTMSLEKVLNQRIETLSKGFKRRVGMAQAILHDPDVLILDEPTDGLDPNQKHQVREMIKGLSKDKIVIISTHILEEVSAVCSRVMVLAGGGIVSDSTPEDLQKRSRFHGAVVIEVQDPNQDIMSNQFLALAGVSNVLFEEARIVLLSDGQNDDLLRDAMSLCREQEWQINAIYRETGRLDEVFRDLTEGASR